MARLAALLQQSDALKRLEDYGIVARDIEAGVSLMVDALGSGAFDRALEWQRQFAQIAAAAGVSL